MVVAGPKEVWLAVRVHEDSGKLHPVIGPDLDLADVAAVLAHFDLLVTDDSGSLHLAAALGVRCVVLVGATDPRRTARAGEGREVLTRDLSCAPYFQGRCPMVYHGAMRGLTIRSERLLMEQLDYNLLFRWFLGMDFDEKVWAPTVFTKNRDRLLEGDVAARFFADVVELAHQKRLLSDEHLTVDGTMIEAWAGHKSFRRKGGNEPFPFVGPDAALVRVG